METGGIPFPSFLKKMLYTEIGSRTPHGYKKSKDIQVPYVK
jgi:hypothetical protein